MCRREVYAYVQRHDAACGYGGEDHVLTYALTPPAPCCPHPRHPPLIPVESLAPLTPLTPLSPLSPLTVKAEPPRPS